MSITTSTSFGLTDTNALSTCRRSPSTGVPLRIIIDGVLCEPVSLDGVWLTIDGVPAYMEV